jgi:hypothetical protein
MLAQNRHQFVTSWSRQWAALAVHFLLPAGLDAQATAAPSDGLRLCPLGTRMSTGTHHHPIGNARAHDSHHLQSLVQRVATWHTRHSPVLTSAGLRRATQGHHSQRREGERHEAVQASWASTVLWALPAVCLGR